MKVCALCGKSPVVGHTITKRGLAKKVGGVGKRNVRVTKRTFLPNLQKIRVAVGGTPLKVQVCTACLRSGQITKAARRSLVYSAESA
jgi:large subunit ribosomal protein L28